MPLVSIIIPCFNNEAFISESINSALAQTYKDIEIIVVDNGSTDNSIKIIKSYGNQLIFDICHERGAGAARNRGLELAQGEFIKFLDADDYLSTGCISQQVIQAKELSGQDKAIVFGDAEWVDIKGNRLLDIGSAYSCEDGTFVDLAWMVMNAPLTSCPLHQRKYLVEVGGFDNRVTRGQEYDLHMRLYFHGVKFIYKECHCYYYREHPGDERISKQNIKNIAPGHLAMLLRHVELASNLYNGKLSYEIRRAFARNLWRHGRGVIRGGDVKFAGEFFEEARKICPDNYLEGTWGYRCIYHLGGAALAETGSTVFNKLKK